MPELAESFRVRLAEPGDAALLADMATRTFVDAFGAQNTPEDMELHCARNYGVEIQRRELGNPELTYLIAEVAGGAAAFALLRASAAPPCVSGLAPIEIQRFYVDSPWHGSGIAQRLMAACLDEARRRGARTMWLGVFERNAKARRFYEKMGFREVGAQTFTLGTDPQNDRIVARSIDG